MYYDFHFQLIFLIILYFYVYTNVQFFRFLSWWLVPFRANTNKIYESNPQLPPKFILSYFHHPRSFFSINEVDVPMESIPVTKLYKCQCREHLICERINDVFLHSMIEFKKSLKNNPQYKAIYREYLFILADIFLIIYQSN